MRKLPALLFMLISVSARVHAQCHAQSTALRPHLIELYSSEGCSSCPPAEAWLRTLHADSNVVPLEFHVDYWDRLGWRDRFDDPRYTTRQQFIAERDGGTSVYTPQVVLDGRAWAGWYRGGPLPPPVVSPVSLQMSVAAEFAPGAILRVQVESTFVHGEQERVDFADYRTYVVLAEDGLSSQVSAGENRGVLLRHDHVVRAFAEPLPLARAMVDLAIPQEVNLANASMVAFVQNPRDGKVAQVLALPLAQCR